VFCASLADVFDNAVDPAWREDLFTVIEQTPNLDWLLLTKRIGNVGNMLPVPFDFDRLYPNVWIGATITSQAEADRDIPKLLEVPARARFLSMEPLLGPVDLTRIDIDGHRELYPLAGTTGCEDDDGNPMPDLPPLSWVIVGGESGAGARPMHPDWARSLRDQCAAAGVPFLFKQWGEWTPGENVEGHSGTVDTVHWGNDQWIVGRENLANMDGNFEDEPDLYRIGKKAAGRLLDGVQHDGFPVPA
jgi:protein gp37